MTHFKPPNNYQIPGLHLEIDRLRHELRKAYKTLPMNDLQCQITIKLLLLYIRDREIDISSLAGSHDTRKHRHPLAYNYDLQWNYH